MKKSTLPGSCFSPFMKYTPNIRGWHFLREHNSPLSVTQFLFCFLPILILLSQSKQKTAGITPKQVRNAQEQSPMAYLSRWDSIPSSHWWCNFIWNSRKGPLWPTWKQYAGLSLYWNNSVMIGSPDCGHPEIRQNTYWSKESPVSQKGIKKNIQSWPD